jgi:murein DD-endopeptidase MepM/ murein hydrolase activator NlpD
MDKLSKYVSGDRRKEKSGARLRGLARAAAAGLCLVAVLTAAPATASLARAEQDARSVAEDAERAAQNAEATTQRSHHGHPRQPVGSDVDVDLEDHAEANAERDVALASTWQVDPDLLVIQPGDSEATAAARRSLAAITDSLGGVLDIYDLAQAAADGAELRAQLAQVELADARAVATVAAARYREDRDLLAAVMVEAYTTGSTGPFGMLFSADTDQDLVTGMVMLQQMGRSQSRAVVAAQRSRDRLRETAAAVAEAARRAAERLNASESALAQARVARRHVLAEVTEARAMLEDSVLADQVAAARTALQEAAMSPESVTELGAGEFSDVSFPLPDGAAFVDQDNWGHRSDHWATVHTGDDFSAACGTPVLAATGGTVAIRTDQSWSGQWLVMVSTGEGRLTTWYAHLQTLLVSDGDEVGAGQPIGAVGAEGNATGCHLHFELHPDGGTIYEDNADPAAWFHAIGVYPGDS